MQGVALLLSIYCVCAIGVSLLGGLVPLAVRLTHRRMEILLSFVSGVMLGVALLHMLPHALEEMEAAAAVDVHAEIGGIEHDDANVPSRSEESGHTGHGAHGAVETTMLALLAGFLAMFLIERFFSFHQHEAPAETAETKDAGTAAPAARRAADNNAVCGHELPHAHGHRLSWTGAAIGLTLHTLISGVALAASVESESARHGAEASALLGFPTFLVVVLHKPFDSLSIGTLMAAGKRGPRARHVVNFLFSLSIPAGVALFQLGALGAGGAAQHELIGVALAFSAGTFLCIALSDLLPELHFHQHDRVWLSLALGVGLVVAWLSGAAG